MYLHTLWHAADTMGAQSAAFTSNVNEAFQTVTLTARRERYTCVIFRVARSVYFWLSHARTHRIYTHPHPFVLFSDTAESTLSARLATLSPPPHQRWVPDLVTAFQWPAVLRAGIERWKVKHSDWQLTSSRRPQTGHQSNETRSVLRSISWCEEEDAFLKIFWNLLHIYKTIFSHCSGQKYLKNYYVHYHKRLGIYCSQSKMILLIIHLI